MSAIQTITDDLLIEAIDSASQRVVMIAPGVWPPVAEAVARAWQRLGADRVTVILDVDPEICRIGYGSLDALGILQEAATAAGEALGEEPGIRICIVIVDEQTFVFSPTPRLLEAPAGDPPVAGAPQPKGNGVVLNKPPAKLESQLGSGPAGDSARTLGLEPLKKEKLGEVAKDLKSNPPRSFDLARSVNVYNARIQFVEFHVSGYRVSQHTVTLPKHLVSVARKNKDLSRKIESAVKLLDSEDSLVGRGNEGDEAGDIYGPENVSQASVEVLRKAIEEKFLWPVKGVGKIIKRSQIDQFEKEVARLEMVLVSFSKVLKLALSDQFRKTADEIADAILPDVINQLPDKWQKQLGPTPNPEHVRFRIIDDLLHSFGDPEKRCGTLKVSCVFKEVTYDMLKDKEFAKIIEEHFHELPLMEEFSAAKERSPSPQE
jgi:hypothetical protein